MDYAYFRSAEAGCDQGWIYITRFFNRGLEFKEEDGALVADYELVIAVDDDDGRRVEDNHERPARYCALAQESPLAAWITVPPR